ncbi:MAG: MurR/RpiR family transcriptional regulator [Oscillospiraceae bacterium]
MENHNFFDLSSDKLHLLNLTEKKMFNYVAKNMDEVKQMSIRQFAGECYVSTATVYRFIAKLGFNGYKEFITVLMLTDMSRSKAVIPQVMKYKGYREDYLKNLIETVRVIRKEQVKKVHDALLRGANIYIFGTGLSRRAAQYVEQLFQSFGNNAQFAYEDYQIENAIEKMTDNDVAFMMSYTGEAPVLIDALEKIKHRCQPLLVSITRSDNNMVQLMTDLNFYFFADQISYNGHDLTSRVAMIMIIEILLYEFYCEEDDKM